MEEKARLREIIQEQAAKIRHLQMQIRSFKGVEELSKDIMEEVKKINTTVPEISKKLSH